jgi:DNA-binding transcriptional LysR family regulator
MDKPGEMAVFVRVVESGGFSAAARALGLTPSAVSKLIGRLEDRLGARLLYRTTRRLSVTHEGAAFYQRSVRILRDIDDAEQAVIAVHGAPRGLLRVTCAVAFADHQLVPLLPAFLARHPEVEVELIVTDRMLDLVEAGVDVGIRINVPADSALIARLLVDDRRVICAAPDYLARRGTPRVPDDLDRHDCLTWTGEQQGALNAWPFAHVSAAPDPAANVSAATDPAGSSAAGANGRGGNASADEDDVYRRTVSGPVRVNSGETLYAMARAGLGIARLAEFLVGADINEGRLVELLADHHRADPLTIHAVYPHRRHLLPKVRAFVDFLVQAMLPRPPWAVGPPTR